MIKHTTTPLPQPTGQRGPLPRDRGHRVAGVQPRLVPLGQRTRVHARVLAEPDHGLEVPGSRANRCVAGWLVVGLAVGAVVPSCGYSFGKISKSNDTNDNCF
jgi:hypothetical protein